MVRDRTEAMPHYEDWDDYLRNAPRANEDLQEAIAEMRREKMPAARPRSSL